MQWSACPAAVILEIAQLTSTREGFTALGAKYSLEGGMVDIFAGRIEGQQHLFWISFPWRYHQYYSLAAVRPQATTVIENAAKEPHVVDVANF